MNSIKAALPLLLLLISISLEVHVSAKPNPLGLRKRATPENTVVVNDADNYWLVLSKSSYTSPS
jgi:hypothetical protein